MRKEYNIVLMEKELDQGLSLEEITSMYGMLSGIEAIPVDIQGEFSAAMGFVNLTDAEFMDYDLSKVMETVTDILNDMDKENKSGEYQVENGCGISTIKIIR